MSSKSRDLSSDTPDIEVGLPTKPFITNVLADNPFRDQMPSEAMHRPNFGKAGKPAKIQVNSHAVQSWPQKPVYQYDVNHSSTDAALILTNFIHRSRLDLVMRSVALSRPSGTPKLSRASWARALSSMATKLDGKHMRDLAMYVL